MNELPASIRKTLTQPPDWWAAFEQAAQADGATLSEWIGSCCRANLSAAAAASLSSRRPANRPRSDGQHTPALME